MSRPSDPPSFGHLIKTEAAEQQYIWHSVFNLYVYFLIDVFLSACFDLGRHHRLENSFLSASSLLALPLIWLTAGQKCCTRF